MYELSLTSNSSRKLYRQYAEAIENAGGIIVSPDDYEQLEYPSDQMYIDYRWEGKIVTLHLEHSLGISLLSEEMPVSELDNISKIISQSM